MDAPVTNAQLKQLIATVYSDGIFYSEFIREAKKRFIAHVLRSCNGNQCRAARELGMHRNTLSRTLAELKMDAREWNPRLQLSAHPPSTSGRNGTYARYAKAKTRPEKLEIIHAELA